MDVRIANNGPLRIVYENGFNPANLPNTVFYNDPTKPYAINSLANPTDPLAVTTLNDLSLPTYSGVQTVVINKPIFNGTHVTYATNDFINLDAIVASTLTDTQGTIQGWHYLTDASPVAIETLYFYGNKATLDRVEISIETSGKLRVLIYAGGATQYYTVTNVAVASDATWFHWRVDQDAIVPKIYINDIELADTPITNVDSTKWYAGLVGADSARLNCRSINGGGDSNFFNGNQQQIHLASMVFSPAVNTQMFNHNQP